jgi:(p)ppGpp synthase/HD superfamily hydrolase
MNNKETRQFAIDAHGSQMYGNHPYSFHLDMVAKIVAPFGNHAKKIAYLHDVVEDTNITLETIRTMFGDFIANCVGLVTDEKGKNRQERKLKTNEKLSKVKGRNKLALIVKTADRFVNVSVAITDNNIRLIKMYQKEHLAFKEAVYRKYLCDYIWLRLDRDIKSINEEKS